MVIADDELLVREGLARLLAELGVEVAATAAEPADALRKVRAHRPDVLVTDLRMPPAHEDEGLQLARSVVREHPRTGVVVLSQHAVTAHALALLEIRAGGMGYLLKHRVGDVRAFVATLRRVASGGTAVDPEVVSGMLGRAREADPLLALTAKEREVLGLMAEGLSNRAITERLVVGPKTTESHVAAIFRKLGLPQTGDESRRVLAVLAYLRAG